VIVSCRLDLLQLGLIAFLAASTGAQASWSYQQPVLDAGPGTYVTCTLAGGPGPSGAAGAYGQAIYPPETLTVGVLAVAEQRYALILNGYQYHYDGLAGDTTSTVRDGLLAAITADVEAPVAASATGLGGITITPTEVGGVWSYEITGPLTLVADLADEAVLVTSARLVCQLRVEAFSTSRSPRAGAWATITRVLAGLKNPNYAMDYLALNGIAVWLVGQPIDLSSLEGSRWQSRTSFDLYVTILSTSVSPVDVIEHLAIGVSGPQINTQIET